MQKLGCVILSAHLSRDPVTSSYLHNETDSSHLLGVLLGGLLVAAVLRPEQGYLPRNSDRKYCSALSAFEPLVLLAAPMPSVSLLEELKCHKISNESRCIVSPLSLCTMKLTV